MVYYKTALYISGICLVAYLLTTVLLRRDVIFSQAKIASLLAAGSAIICLIFPGFLTVAVAFFLLPFFLAKNSATLAPTFATAILVSPDVTDTFTVLGINGFAYSIQMSIASGFLLYSFIRGRGKSSFAAGTTAPAIIFVGMLYIIAIRGTDLTNWIREALHISLAYAFAIWIIKRSDLERQSIEAWKVSLISIGMVLSCIALFESIWRWPLYTVIDEQLGIYQSGLIVKMRDGLLRARGPFSDQTDFGFILVICFAACLSFSTIFKNKLSQVMALSVLFLGASATQSRGAILGTAVVLAAWAFVADKSKRVSRLTIGSTVGALVYLTVRYQNIFSQQPGDASSTVDYRYSLFSRGTALIAESPAVGYQYGDLLIRMSDMKQGEGIVDVVNSYLYFGLLLGIPGFIAFIAYLYWPVLSTLRSPRWPISRANKEIDIFCICSLLSAATMYAFTSLVPRATLLVLIVSIIAMANSSAKKRRQDVD